MLRAIIDRSLVVYAILLTVLVLGLWLALLVTGPTKVARADPPPPGPVVLGAGPRPPGLTQQGVVSSAISYQGRLLGSGGLPLPDGSYVITFTLYNTPTAGSALQTLPKTVSTTNGLFATPLEVNPGLFTGQELWLEMQVGGETLSPRQALRPVPYALSLRPGATISGTAGSAILNVVYTPSVASAVALQAQVGSGAGVNRFGVYGIGEASNDLYGWTLAGVFGDSRDGTGVAGVSLNNTGVWGLGPNEYGVRGTSYGNSGAGVRGENSVAGLGGYFTSISGTAVLASASLTSTAAISGTNTYGYGGYFASTSGTALYAQSPGSPALAVSGTTLLEGPVYVTGTLRAQDATFSGVISSTVVSGTAPFSVTSPTLVPNLNADMVDGLHAGSFQRVYYDGLLPAGTTTTIEIPHYTLFTLQLSGGWPYQGGLAFVQGFENDWYVGVAYVKYNGDGTSAHGGAECDEGSTTTLLQFGSSGHIYTVRCPGEASGAHNLVLEASEVELRYRLIY